MATALLERLLGRFAGLTNRFRVWHRWPFLIAMPTLVGLRVNMREHNLFDTETRSARCSSPRAVGRRPRSARRPTAATTTSASRGWAWPSTRFGRNVPIAETFGEQPPGLYEPNPRLVSTQAAARARVRAGAAPQRAGAGLAAVHGARLAEPRRATTRRPPHEFPRAGGRRLARRPR